MSAAELQGIPNLVPVKFTDGAYYNFPESQKIRDGIYLIKAKGHTNGNSIVVVEKDGLFYMFHGDITYVDEALYENKLSIVFDDPAAARETFDRVRAFVQDHPTVYCGTHTQQGYENLEAARVMDLANPVPTVLAEVDFSQQKASSLRRSSTGHRLRESDQSGPYKKTLNLLGEGFRVFLYGSAGSALCLGRKEQRTDRLTETENQKEKGK